MKKKVFFLDFLKKNNEFCNGFQTLLYNESTKSTLILIYIIKGTMNENERDLVFSEAVKAGKRIYYFDVKQTRNGDRYVSITESKKIIEGSYENPRISFEKHKLFLYKEDYEKFLSALMRTLDVAKSNIVPSDLISSNEQTQSYQESKETEIEVVNEVKEAVEDVKPEIITPAADSISKETTPVVSEEPVSAPAKEEEGFKIDLDF